MYEKQQQTQSMLLKHWFKGIMFSTLYILVYLAYLNINWREKAETRFGTDILFCEFYLVNFQTLCIIDNYKLKFYVLYKSLNRKVTKKIFFVHLTFRHTWQNYQLSYCASFEAKLSKYNIYSY